MPANDHPAPADIAHDQLDRRSALGALGAGALGLTALAGAARADTHPAASHAKKTSSGSPKNVIFMVSDGMSIGVLQLADRVHQLRHQGEHAPWVKLMGDPVAHTGLIATHSANSEVTDSAAAASAWSIGKRVPNRRLNVDADDRSYEPIFARAARRGLARGLVSTATLTHATPAGFTIAHAKRNEESIIAEKMLAAPPEVMLGGGRRFLTDELLAQDASSADTVRTRDELRAAPSGSPSGPPLIGVFSQGHMAYELDRDPAAEPSLAEMSTAALRRLDQLAAPGFLLQIEAARVDHAAHANDAAGVIADQLAFEQAVAAVLRWLEGRDDTLLVVTTDHGNASPNLTVYLEAALSGLERAITATQSFESLLATLRTRFLDPARAAPEALRPFIAKATGVELTTDELALFARSLAGESVAPANLRDKPHLVLASILSNHTGINFVSGNHTAEHVVQTAVGPGAEQLPRIGHLTDTHDAVVGLLDLPPATTL